MEMDEQLDGHELVGPKEIVAVRQKMLREALSAAARIGVTFRVTAILELALVL